MSNLYSFIAVSVLFIAIGVVLVAFHQRPPIDIGWGFGSIMVSALLLGLTYGPLIDIAVSSSYDDCIRLCNEKIQRTSVSRQFEIDYTRMELKLNQVVHKTKELFLKELGKCVTNIEKNEKKRVTNDVMLLASQSLLNVCVDIISTRLGAGKFTITGVVPLEHNITTSNTKVLFSHKTKFDVVPYQNIEQTTHNGTIYIDIDIFNKKVEQLRAVVFKV